MNPDCPTSSTPTRNDTNSSRFLQAASILRISPEHLAAALAAQSPSNALSLSAEPTLSTSSPGHGNEARDIVDEQGFEHWTEAERARDFSFDFSLPTELDGNLGTEAVENWMNSNLQQSSYMLSNKQQVSPHLGVQATNAAFNHNPTLFPLLPYQSDTGNEQYAGSIPHVNTLPGASTSVDPKGSGGPLSGYRLTPESLHSGQSSFLQNPQIASNPSPNIEPQPVHAITDTEESLTAYVNAVVPGPCSKVWKIPPKPVSFFTHKLSQR